MLVVGTQHSFYLCNLKKIMNGPSEQTLEQFGTCFVVPRNLEQFKFNELNLTSENIIADQIYVDKGNSYQPVLRLYNTKQSTATAEGNYLVSVAVLEPDSFLQQ